MTSSNPKRSFKRLAPIFLAGLGSCMVGPQYHRPAPVISQQFKENEATLPKDATPWKKASPEMASFSKGKWWEIFNDAVLNGLEEQVEPSNQNLKEYEAQYRKAQAMIDSAKANLFPTVNGSWKFNRNGQGGQSRIISGTDAGGTGYTRNTWSLSPTVSWTIDIWGMIRRQIQQQADTAQADAALLANMRLSYQLDLAVDYFTLRYQDSLIDLYTRNVELYTRNLEILENQLSAGVADPTSVLQARYLLQNTKATLESAHIARAQYEHAIAVLVGRAPADLSIPYGALPTVLPESPQVVPSYLLERRPDIAQAERNMASANAEIGYEIGAFFPQISLNANFGYTGDPLPNLISAATQFWGLGAGASETIFQGGARSAAVHAARADYDNAVATYKQTVLTALQDTEDQLSSLHWLERQYKEQDLAVATAQNGVRVAMNEYLAGTQIYTTVITAQQTALQYEQSQLQIREQRLLAQARLIADLGGGWSIKELPTKWNLEKDNPLLPSFIQKDGEGIFKKNTKYFPKLKN